MVLENAMANATAEVLTSILMQLNNLDVDIDTVTTVAPTSAKSGPKLSALSGPSSKQAKSCLMTLHFLFPHELLPALDLIDRNLITKLQHTIGGSERSTQIFYVQSASAVTGVEQHRPGNARFRNAWIPTKMYYEVRLDSWNCTCAAFTHSQLKMLLLEEQTPDIDSASSSFNGLLPISDIYFGGSVTKADGITPVCKHILAAIMCTTAPNLFGRGCTCKDVSAEDLAGWAAGVGEGMK